MMRFSLGFLKLMRTDAGISPSFGRIVTLALAVLFIVPVQAADRPLPLPLAPDLPIELVMGQSTVTVDVNRLQYSGGGVLEFLIIDGVNSAMENAGERRLVDIRELLAGFDFNRELEQVLREKIPSESLSPAPRFDIRKELWKGKEVASNASWQPGLVMVVVPHYAFSANFEKLTVRLAVSLEERERRSSGKGKANEIDERIYQFVFWLDPIPGQSRDATAARWIGVGRDELISMLRQGIGQVADMVAYDFSPEGRSEGAAKVRGNESGRFQDLKTFGRPLRMGDAWYWTRTYYRVDESHKIKMIQGIRPLRGQAYSGAQTPATSHQAPADDKLL